MQVFCVFAVGICKHEHMMVYSVKLSGCGQLSVWLFVYL